MGTRALAGPFARRASLVALGALAVHQLRYAIAYGDGASAELAREGHSYLGDVAPTLVVLVLSVVFARLFAARVGRLDPTSSRPAGLPRQALSFAVALAAIFAAQELTEGALSAGHPGGTAALVAGGGLLALPLALAIGFVAASIDRLLADAESSMARGGRSRWVRRPRPVRAAEPQSPSLISHATRCLAFGLARRPPPVPLR